MTASTSRNLEQARSALEQRRMYRRQYYLENKERENAKSKERYHSKYKLNPAFKSRSSERWKRYAKEKGAEWVLLRSRKYRKPYAALSKSTRSNIREAYKAWAKLNWDRRVEYAREYRRRKATFGFRNKIAQARRSGDIRKLAEECLDAIVRAYGEGRGD